MKKHASFFCGDNDSYVHGGLYILVELPLIAAFVDGSVNSTCNSKQGYIGLHHLIQFKKYTQHSANDSKQIQFTN